MTAPGPVVIGLEKYDCIWIAGGACDQSFKDLRTTDGFAIYASEPQTIADACVLPEAKIVAGLF
jgi:hypothetical protein